MGTKSTHQQKNQAEPCLGNLHYTFLSTDEACDKWAMNNHVAAPIADTYMVKGEGINKMFSLSYSSELNGPVTGLQQGLQAIVNHAHHTNEQFIVLTMEQYNELKEGK